MTEGCDAASRHKAFLAMTHHAMRIQLPINPLERDASRVKSVTTSMNFLVRWTKSVASSGGQCIPMTRSCSASNPSLSAKVFRAAPCGIMSSRKNG